MELLIHPGIPIAMIYAAHHSDTAAFCLLGIILFAATFLIFYATYRALVRRRLL